MDAKSFVLIHQFAGQIQSAGGRPYTAEVWGQQRDDATWVGWLEFRPAGGSDQILRTERETTQPDRDALAYWASGLEPVYLEGALARARPRLAHPPDKGQAAKPKAAAKKPAAKKRGKT